MLTVAPLVVLSLGLLQQQASADPTESLPGVYDLSMPASCAFPNLVNNLRDRL